MVAAMELAATELVPTAAATVAQAACHPPRFRPPLTLPGPTRPRHMVTRPMRPRPWPARRRSQLSLTRTEREGSRRRRAPYPYSAPVPVATPAAGKKTRPNTRHGIAMAVRNCFETCAPAYVSGRRDMYSLAHALAPPCVTQPRVCCGDVFNLCPVQSHSVPIQYSKLYECSHTVLFLWNQVVCILTRRRGAHTAHTQIGRPTHEAPTRENTHTHKQTHSPRYTTG